MALRLPLADAALLGRLAADWNDAAQRSGPDLVCHEGCTDCCIGPFPITSLDALRLRAGLEELRRRAPERARAIAERADRAAAEMTPVFPGDAATGQLDEDGDEDAEERFCGSFAALPCPALHPETGACELYAFRPVSCRTFGPPVLLNERPLPPCHLCFQGAAPERIEACRVAPDPEGIEDRLLDEIEGDGAPRAHTLIAFALRRGQ